MKTQDRLPYAPILIALATLVAFLGSLHAHAMPAQIVIIRHGEKTGDTDVNLNQQGCERAYALPRFFETDPVVTQYGPPAAIFAAAGQDKKHREGAIRAGETITPTALKLGLPIQETYTVDDAQALARSVMNDPRYNGKTLVISWVHENIPDLAQALGAQLPKKLEHWPGDVFDEAWVLRFSPSQKTPSLQIEPERVLPTDNPRGGSDWAPPSATPTCGNVPTGAPSACDIASLQLARESAIVR